MLQLSNPLAELLKKSVSGRSFFFCADVREGRFSVFHKTPALGCFHCQCKTLLPPLPLTPLPGTAGFFCVSQRKFRCESNIFGQSAIKCNEKIGPCKNRHFVDKVRGGYNCCIEYFRFECAGSFLYPAKTAVPGRDRDRKGGLTAQLATMQKG